MAPTDIPQTIPIYNPISLRFNTKANNHTKTISKINALKNVNTREIVPLPIAWNKLPDIIPKGISKIKKHIIRMQSTTPADKTAESTEYEKMNDSGSANMKRNEPINIDEIIPSVIP